MPNLYIALFYIKLRHTRTHAQNTHTHVINTGAVPIVQVVGEAGARKNFASLGEYVEWRMALEKKSSEGILVKLLIAYFSRYTGMLISGNLHVNVVCVCVCMCVYVCVCVRTHTHTYLTVSDCRHTQHTHTDGQQLTIFIRGQTCGKMP